ncbi:MAG TPA: flagellar export protein FliJ [Solirubrobacteraceae bacterium]|nr:flagellar export protein FliJ [Solirubrobacteraceae bacterium]
MSNPSFVFSLERVREVRAHEEDMAREAFAASLSLRARGVALLADAQARAAAAREQAVAETTPRSGAALISAQAWLERVQRSQEQAALELDRRSAELEQRRVALTSAGQRRQVLERLKDRKRQAHHAETNRREAVALDEIAMTGHVRRLAS